MSDDRGQIFQSSEYPPASPERLAMAGSVHKECKSMKNFIALRELRVLCGKKIVFYVNRILIYDSNHEKFFLKI